MAYKINGSTVIDDNRNLFANSINLNGTVISTAPVGGSDPLSEIKLNDIGTLLQTLSNPNAYSTSNGDYFGRSVAISGNYCIVGAYNEDDSSGTESGKAYIFDVTTGSLLRTLNNPNAYGTSLSDNFGRSVAISGNYCIVGAYNEDDSSGTESGKAYIFDVTTGSLLRTLNNPNAYSTSASDLFGISVAISGNYCVVGAHNEDDSGGSSSGKAYIFDVTTGALLRTLNNPNAYSTSASDVFGYSVAISGNYCIVGAYIEDDSGGSGSGKAYIFDVTTGSLLQTLNNPNAYGTSLSDNFGYSVDISGTKCIVGAFAEDDSGGTDSGKAYIFDVTTGSLLQILNNPNAYSTSATDYFGRSVAISGNYCIVGAHQEDDLGGSNSGKAYIFDVTTGSLLRTLNNPNAYGTSLSDNFGRSVAISGNYCIVGAYNEDDSSGTDSGKVYIFSCETIYDMSLVESISFTNGAEIKMRDLNYLNTINGVTNVLNNPNAYGTSSMDYFGSSVAISGTKCIVGAYFEDDSGGTQSGKAYIFDVSTGSLLQTLNNPNAYNTSAYDYFGSSVAISGNKCIVGAHNEADSGGLYSGKAYIFDVTTGALLQTLNNPNAYGTSLNDYFGRSVAISGNYCIVGAYIEDESGGTDSGKAYIFDVTTGYLLQTLNNPNAYSTSLSDNFGLTVAIDGTKCIVGAYQEDDSGGTDSGKAYIFDVTTGALLQTLNNPNAYDTSLNDNFGSSVAISGNYCIVGDYQEDDSGGPISGKAYIFDVSTGSLLRTLNNPNAYGTSASDYFGSSVAIDGTKCIVGAYAEDDSGGTDSGKAYIFDVTTGALLQTLNNPNAYGTSASDYFGSRVAISGNKCIVGAYQEDELGGSDSGKAYIFDLNNNQTVIEKLLNLGGL